MADETTRDNAQILKDNPQLAEAIAKFLSSDSCRDIMAQQILATLSTDTAGVLAAAREKVQRGIIPVSHAAGGKAKMTREQLGEWFRVSIARMHNRAVDPNGDLDADGIITQALTGSVGSAGGYMIPEDFTTELQKRADKKQVVWPLLSKRPTTRDLVHSTEVTGYVTPNVGTAAKSRSATTTDVIAATEPTFGDFTWTMRTMDARVPLKVDLLDDAAINVLEVVLALVTDGFVRKREAYPIVGTGAAGGLPTGLLNVAAGITGVTVADVTHLSTILGFMENIPMEYRQSSTVLMGSNLFFKAIATLAENVRAAQFLVDALPPIKECSDMPVGKILGGDFGRYVVYYNVLMKMLQSVAAERWTLEMAFQEKWDGNVVIHDAFRIGNVTSY